MEKNVIAVWRVVAITNVATLQPVCYTRMQRVLRGVAVTFRPVHRTPRAAHAAPRTENVICPSTARETRSSARRMCLKWTESFAKEGMPTVTRAPVVLTLTSVASYGVPRVLLQINNASYRTRMGTGTGTAATIRRARIIPSVMMRTSCVACSSASISLKS
uniref:Uncharacterized protein n=1 Tax=Cacopsylla melanoneura TaxID=428564 RepID=A0A8D8YT73_9HEMI